MEELQVNAVNGQIECNFEEIKQELQTMMSAYTSLEVTEDTIKKAKEDLATLRKIYKAVDGKRKEVKKVFMQPYLDFEEKTKDLLSVIDEPIDMIDGKLKTFEIKRIAEKFEHQKEIYAESIGEYAEYLPFDKVRKKQWDNATYSDKDIKYDISKCIAKVRSDLDNIRALKSDIEDELFKTYRESGNNLSAAVTRFTDYMSVKSLADAKALEKVSEKPEKGKFKIVISGEENYQKVKEYLEFAEIPYEEV